jgi:gliding motility-associated-like protein
MRGQALVSLLLPALLAHGSAPAVAFTENRGQWPAQVLYRALIPGGALFVERNALTYVLAQGGRHAHHGHVQAAPEAPAHTHAYRVTFEGATGGTPAGSARLPHHENHFLGNDPAHWGAHCSVFGEVRVRDLYPGIDLVIDGARGVKYQFELEPGADPGRIRMRYEGQDRIEARDGGLHVVTSAGTVREEAPVSWLRFFDGIDNMRRMVPSAYQLRGSTVTFDVARSNDLPLVIDPELTFASYSGSTSDNFGFTATYDNDGALYGGGIVFGTGYPTTLGAMQTGFGGGAIDIGISKWTPDGEELQWSTYIGGAGNETPNSLVVNSADELFILAVTGSADFPTTPGCFDPTFNGGTVIPLTGGFVNLSGGEGYDFAAGTDVAIVHLAADGGSLIGSTFLGGSGNDGLNQGAQLVHNYGDHFRGEIALDGQERPVIATSTQSQDIPVTAGAAQPAFGGGDLDALLFRMNAALTTLEYATYCGGGQGDSGHGVQFSSTGDIYLTGGTASPDLPMPAGAYQGAHSGGADGYITRYAANGTLLSATYLGTASYDQCFFVQLDLSDGVFVVGQTHGAYPVTPGKYADPGSAQFIHKLSTDLGTSDWSTVIGNGNGDEDISPSAFLVSNCGQIYFCGWGGSVNDNVNGDASTTAGLPVTANAFQSTTDGSDFYVMVLTPEAEALAYATFFGSNASAEHVDGGSSRFDKNGNVYQAVCAGCGGSDGFPTTPGAWSNTNNSSNCNLGVFKFNLSEPVAQIGIDGPGHICIPDAASFINESVGGSTFDWDFGDGSGSNAFEPQHVYADTGTYTVTLVLGDSLGCLAADTAQITVVVQGAPVAVADPVGPICVGASVQLEAQGGDTYAWSPPDSLSALDIPDPVASPDTTTTYQVVVTNLCGTDSTTVLVVIGEPVGGAGPDTVTCLGAAVPISAFGGGTYLWSPATSLDDPTSASPLAAPPDTTIYAVTITTPEGCLVQDTLVVNVQSGLPEPIVDDAAVCLGNSVQLMASGGDAYAWQPAAGITQLDVPDPVVQPLVDTHYLVLVSNTCGSVADSAFVDVQEVVPDAWPDTVICPGAQVLLAATGGDTYAWSPAAGLDDATSAMPVATPDAATVYTVTATNALGCSGQASVNLQLHPEPFVGTGPDTGINYGESAQLLAWGEGVLAWSPAATLSCDSCMAPVATPSSTTTYTVQLTDGNGCRASATVTVFVNGVLYVPNTFTPDGDGLNDLFLTRATEVGEFRLLVFNRWGEEIFASTALDRGWDGTYQGVASPIGTYAWRIDLREINGTQRTVFGHVNLVR